MSLQQKEICEPDLLKRRRECSLMIHIDPYNPMRYYQRGLTYQALGFPDLAAADAYRALTLFDSVLDPDTSEYPALKRVGPEALLDLSSLEAFVGSGGDSEDYGNYHDEENPTYEPISDKEYAAHIIEVYELLVKCLAQCGCLRDAYDMCMQATNLPIAGINGRSQNTELRTLLNKIKEAAISTNKDLSDFDPTTLPAQGHARRSLYPWNTHEPDRNKPQVVQFLNERLAQIAPKCEVRTTALPSLHDSVVDGNIREDITLEGGSVSIQLGLFAKEDIAPGEVILHESSMLTATNRLHDDICDACNGRLPELSSSEPPVACEDCHDTIFCSQKCHDLAQELYHGAMCGQDGLESIGKDVPDPKDKADYLYLLLLERSIAMAATQDVHPLELPEVKYIWGDFSSLDEKEDYLLDANFTKRPTSATLPFSFQLNIVQPMRILDEMGIDPFKSLDRYDTWVLNTLYAKFRGTASGRLSTWDGGPEVCAVHPLWCLANHSCDPNVRWEWGGEITFTARTKEARVKWGPDSKSSMGGISKGEEILNHYCDISLPVKERREWAMGALGGACLCERCVWEVTQA
ncbi:hypothetical protein MGYG_09106 [Nannizzia gypsea CBS 118893]|uniref:SET domain-containing protein n=1 Tax=Arthroderma gypseum (strain ATCC MYA-4604 / CBS 118893) TaxID=535722 RepID=E4V045_ARTGP|nr:hypothetical protein MGYG_09106 [Nannizzia gypsea CBS 118893]EFR02982.1 hypothetical protein MGYG_09106 [Nannizzia gypsea CBS 118893]